MISLKQISTRFHVKLTIYIVSKKHMVISFQLSPHFDTWLSSREGTLNGFWRVYLVQISPQQFLVRHLAAPLAHVNVPKRAGQDDADRAEEDRDVNAQPG